MSHCIVYPISFTGEMTPTRRLLVARVGPHQVVVGDHYREGQLGFFIPAGARVPDKLAEEMWVLGKLGGKRRNRVDRKQMDGVWSDGLFYGSQGASWNPAWKVGQDVSRAVGMAEEGDA